MPDLLDLPASVIEQIAKVRLDDGWSAWWAVRALCRATRAASWGARHAVLRPTVENAALVGDAEWCRVLLAGGRTDAFEALLHAVKTGHADAARVVLAHGKLDDMDAYHALIAAVRQDDAQMVGVVLAHENCVALEGHRALRTAAWDDCAEAARALLAHGAGPLCSFNGKTALDHARQAGSARVLGVLEAHLGAA